MRIPGNNTLYYFLSSNPSNNKLFRACKLTQIPDRQTIDRRFELLPIGIIISMMGPDSSEGLVESNSTSVDNSMLKAASLVWHKSEMKNSRIQITGIDTVNYHHHMPDHAKHFQLILQVIQLMNDTFYCHVHLQY